MSRARQPGEIEVPLDHGAGSLVLGDIGVEFAVDSDSEHVVVAGGGWPDMYLWAGISRVESGTFTVDGMPHRAARVISIDGAQLVVPCTQADVLAAMCTVRMRPSAREGSSWVRLSRASREMARRDDRGTSDSGYGMSNIIIFTLAAAGALFLAVTGAPSHATFELVMAGLFGWIAVHQVLKLRRIARELETMPVVPPGGLPWPPHGWRPDPET